MKTVTIERLGHHGDGIAAGPVFVARALPGEVVEGDVVEGRIANPRILHPSPERIKAPCAHYRNCGGCALQHVRTEFATDWKENVIRQALDAHGLDASFRPTHVAPLYSRRRATFAGRRTKAGALVGFHARGSHVVTSVASCMILHPDLTNSLPLLEELVAQFGTRKGEMALSLARAENGLDLSIIANRRLDDRQRADLAHWAGQSGFARLAWDGEIIAQAYLPVHRLGPALVTPPPNAFLQATKDAEAAMQASVSEIASGARHVADLFSGCGTFALPLSQQAKVLAVEASQEMLNACELGWRNTSGLRPIQHMVRDLFRSPLKEEELGGLDCVVIDPPRAGAEAQAQEIAASAVPTVAAISCNPVTFARDAKLLVAGGYRLEWVQMIDQFRFSPHVELVARFNR